ncbi:hypothetical protein PoB_000439700 [Plakobranchus ocellatus]|uniref:Uncharacterized protein n=1 Tax=Plakobranchus ocellatus TaxID=259542 RepID=A0AAV3Y623_9GAST|nr:hypothetical protein PoB_000439700 [Plakobranchus ocellatus]
MEEAHAFKEGKYLDLTKELKKDGYEAKKNHHLIVSHFSSIKHVCLSRIKGGVPFGGQECPLQPMGIQEGTETDEFLRFESENVASPGTKIAHNQHSQVYNFCRGGVPERLDPALCVCILCD